MDNDPLRYFMYKNDSTALPLWLHFDDQSKKLFGTPATDDIGIYNFTINVTDGF